MIWSISFISATFTQQQAKHNTILRTKLDVLNHKLYMYIKHILAM